MNELRSKLYRGAALEVDLFEREAELERQQIVQSACVSTALGLGRGESVYHVSAPQEKPPPRWVARIHPHSTPLSSESRIPASMECGDEADWGVVW